MTWATLFQLGTDLKKAPTRNAKAPQSRQAQAEGFDNTGVGPISGDDAVLMQPANAGGRSICLSYLHSRQRA